jgi:hypothetical protein
MLPLHLTGEEIAAPEYGRHIGAPCFVASEIEDRIATYGFDQHAIRVEARKRGTPFSYRKPNQCSAGQETAASHGDERLPKPSAAQGRIFEDKHSGVRTAVNVQYAWAPISA